jgi:putative Holliday junction resolvase
MKEIISVILGFDFGMKYIGVATGQTITKTATPVTCIRAIDGIPDWQEIEQLIKTWQPTELIVGIPLNMDDSSQLLTHCATKFANRLKHKFKLPVHMVDERLSTWEAKHRLTTNIKNPTSKQLAQINATSAAILIEQWFTEQA